MTQGYAHTQGSQAPHIARGKSRRLPLLKRMSDGAFVRTSLEQALDEIEARLREILQRHTPRAVAAYRGTQGYLNVAAFAVMPTFLRWFGSPCLHASATTNLSTPAMRGWRRGSIRWYPCRP